MQQHVLCSVFTSSHTAFLYRLSRHCANISQMHEVMAALPCAEVVSLSGRRLLSCGLRGLGGDAHPLRDFSFSGADSGVSF